MITIEYFLKSRIINFDEILDILKLFFPKRVISIFKICKHVFITNERDSKLLKIYYFDYKDHTYANYVSEKLYVKLKSTQNLETAYFSFKNALYLHCKYSE